MATTFETLLVRLATSVDELIQGIAVSDYTLSGQCSGAGSTTTAVDTANRWETADTLHNTFFRITDDTGQTTNRGAIRLVTTYDISSKTMTLNSALPAATSSTTKYQLYRRVHPNVYMQLINEAADACYPYLFKRVLDTSLTFTPNTYTYNMLSISGLRDVYKVEIQADMGNSAAPYFELEAWDVEETDGVKNLRIIGDFTSGAIIKIHGIGDVTNITSIATPTSSQSIELNEKELLPLLTYAEAHLWKYKAGKADNSDRTDKFVNMYQVLIDKWERQLRKYRMAKPDIKLRRDWRGV